MTSEGDGTYTEKKEVELEVAMEKPVNVTTAENKDI